MRRVLPAFVLILVGTVALAGADCVQLFMKAKDQYRLAAYAAALETLDRLEQESEKPGNEAVRAQLRPGLAFYRGATLAALGRTDEARPQLELFLTYQPNVTLDPSTYPPKVIALIEEIRRHPASAQPAPPESSSIAASYRAYVPPKGSGSEEEAEDWAEGPARYILTAEQREDFSRLPDSVARAEYIAQFWKAHDPKTETAINEAREEFERRVAFADAHFAQDEKRGSTTDRGMVFVLLGPPTWVGRRPFVAGEDANEPKGMSLYTDLDLSNALKGQSSAAGSALTFDRMTAPGTKLPDSDSNYHEIWHYRRELLPATISFQQMDFDFITRKGYGHNVLQREGKGLATLEMARQALRAGTFSRTATQ